MKYPLALHALQLINKGLAIYGEVTPSRTDLRKWLQLGRYQETEDGPHRYVVRSFELLVSDLVHEYDVAGREENMVRHEFDTLEDALACLDGMQQQPVHWESWQETDCPI